MVPILLWLTAALTGTAVVKVARPKLPVYNVQIASIPRLRWTGGRLRTVLPTHVSLTNDNFIGIGVHAIKMDLFYTSVFDGELYHIGNVIDESQPATTVTVNPERQTKSVPNDLKQKGKKKRQPVWKMGARAVFEKRSNMLLGIDSISATVSSILSLVRYLWNLGDGTLILPSTGVAHVKTSGGVPATVTLFCDNVVWGLTVQGRECTLQKVQTGWVALDAAAASAREIARSRFRASTDTGGMFLKQRTSNGELATMA